MADEPTGSGRYRAGNADREVVAADLRDAFSEGRLDSDEYFQRLEAVWEATTYGELERLTADLPQPWERKRAAAEQQRRRGQARAYLREWKSWFGAAVVMIAIWAISSISQGEPATFWPVWPLGIWAAILVGNASWKD